MKWRISALIFALVIVISCVDTGPPQPPSATSPPKQSPIPPVKSRADSVEILLITADSLSKRAKYDSTLLLQRRAFRYAAAEFPGRAQWSAEKQVQCLNALTRTWTRMSLYDSAHAAIAKSRHIASIHLDESHSLHADIRREEGVIFHMRGDYSQAILCYENSLKISQATPEDNHQAAAETYNNLGVIWRSLGEYDRAIHTHKKSLSLRRLVFGSTHVQVGESFFNLGLDYRRQGDYQKALAYFDSAHVCWQSQYPDNHLRYAFLFNNIGLVHLDRTDFDHALEFLKKSLSIKLAHLSKPDYSVAMTYENIGSIHRTRSNFDSARHYFQISLELLLELRGTRHPKVADAHSNLGETERLVGNLELALKRFETAQKIRRQAYGETHPELATSFADIGETLRLQGKLKSAQAYQQKALKLRTANLPKHHPQIAASFLALADIEDQASNHSKALEFNQRAIKSLVAELGGNGRFPNPGGDLLIADNMLVEAMMNKGLRLNRLAQWESEPDVQRKWFQLSLETLKQTVQLIDRLRLSYRAESSKLFLAERDRLVYSNGVQVALKLYEFTEEKGHLEDAFWFAERSRGRVLQEALYRVQAFKHASIPDSLLLKERSLRSRLADYSTRILRRRYDGYTQETQLAAWQDSCFYLNRSYQALLSHIEQNHREYHLLTHQTSSVSIADIQTLLDDSSAVVEYFSGDSLLVAFVIRNSDAFAVELVQIPNLMEAVTTLKKAILTQEFYEYRAVADSLYRMLVSPLEPVLGRRETTIIPDNELSELPFELLLTSSEIDPQPYDFRSLPYLLKKQAINYAYSAQLFSRQRESTQTEQQQADFIAFAPAFKDSSQSKAMRQVLAIQNDSNERNSPFNSSALPASVSEVRDIEDLFLSRLDFTDRIWNIFSGQNINSFLYGDATELNLKQEELTRFRFLHFATHGFINSDRPEFSGLIFSHDAASNEDAILFLEEIYNLNLNAELVTLSACETGSGKLASGEGIIGITRGFLHAGARNLLVSLWSVSDVSTGDLMVEFYRNLLHGMSKTRALQQAKLTLLDSNPDFAKPFYWGPFILIGR